MDYGCIIENFVLVFVAYVSIITGFMLGKTKYDKPKQTRIRLAKNKKSKLVMDEDPYAEALKRPRGGISTL